MLPHCQRVFVCVFRLLRFSKPSYHLDRTAKEDPCVPKCILAFAFHVAFLSALSCRSFCISLPPHALRTWAAKQLSFVFCFCILMLGVLWWRNNRTALMAHWLSPTSYGSGSLEQIDNRARCNAIHGILDDAPRSPYRASN